MVTRFIGRQRILLEAKTALASFARRELRVRLKARPGIMREPFLLIKPQLRISDFLFRRTKASLIYPRRNNKPHS